jgi:hypothetical protein
MAADDPRTHAEQDGASPAEQTASNAGAIVAEQVRHAIESAETAAEELERQAAELAASDRDEVDRAASRVLARIDAVQAKVAGLLDDVRNDVRRIAEEAKRPQPEPAMEPPPREEPAPAPQPAPAAPARPAAPPQPAAARPQPSRRLGRFRRRARAPQRCDVCARSAQPGEQELGRWHQVSRMSLCPECQADGWQLPSGGTVPYRATRQRETG